MIVTFVEWYGVEYLSHQNVVPVQQDRIAPITVNENDSPFGFGASQDVGSGQENGVSNMDWALL